MAKGCVYIIKTGKDAGKVFGSKESLAAHMNYTPALTDLVSRFQKSGGKADIDSVTKWLADNGYLKATPQAQEEVTTEEAPKGKLGRRERLAKLFEEPKVEVSPTTEEAVVEATPEMTPEEVRINMKPITDEMANVEMEFSNNGYSIDWDYDNEIIITDNKTGDIVDTEELPEKLLPLAAQYEKATAGLAGYDFESYRKALEQSRKDVGGIETEFEEVKPAALPEKIEPKKQREKIEYVANKLRGKVKELIGNAKGTLSRNEVNIFEREIESLEKKAIQEGNFSFDEKRGNPNYEKIDGKEQKVNTYEADGYTVKYESTPKSSFVDVITPSGETIRLIDRKYKNQSNQEVVFFPGAQTTEEVKPPTLPEKPPAEEGLTENQKVNALISKKNRYNKIPKTRKSLAASLLNEIKTEAEQLGFTVVDVKRGNISVVSKESGKVVARREVDRKFNKERNDKLKEAKSMAEDSILGLRASILTYFLRGGKVKTSQSELAGDAEIKAAKRAGLISDNGRSIDMIVQEDLPETGGIIFDEQDAINEVLDVLASFENKAQMEDELIEMRDKLYRDMDEAAKYESEAQMNRALDNGELNEDELVEYYESLSEDDKVKSIEDYEKFYREIEREQPEQEGEGARGARPSEEQAPRAEEQKITYGPNEGLTQTDTAAGPFVSESGNAPYSEPSGVRGQTVREGGVGNTIKAVWNKYKQIKFNGSIKVKDAEDVAHIMRKLEDKSVEHAFAVHVDKNGKAHIQFLGMGGPTGTVVDPRLVLAGAKKFKSKKVYLVHNHPSGSLVASRPDVQLTNRVDNVLSPLGIELEHVIMDTYKKQYVHLYPDDISLVKNRDITKESIEEYNKALKVEVMDEQKILSEPVASIKSSMDVSQFLMQVRFTALPKHGMLLLNNKNEIIGNYIFKKGFDYNEATSFVAEAGVGTAIIFYSNQNQFESGIRPMIKSLESADIKVFDYVIVNSDSEGVKGYYESYADSGKLSETQAKYGTNSIPNELREPTPRSNAELQQLMEDSMDAVDSAIESGQDAQSAVNDLIGNKDWYFGLTAKQKTQFDEILKDEFGVVPTIEQKAEAKAAPAGVGENIKKIIDNYYKLKDGDSSARAAINEILDADPKLKYIYDNIRKINKQLQKAGVITDKTDGCP